MIEFGFDSVMTERAWIGREPVAGALPGLRKLDFQTADEGVRP
jgi:hypothetical protein